MSELEELTLVRAREAFSRAEWSAVELTEFYLHRIEACNERGPALHAINTLDERALDQARACDDAWRRGPDPQRPLLGIPVVLKDHIDVAGLRATYGSSAAAAHVASRDAEVVLRLRRAGAIVLGKAAMADFGLSLFSTSSLSGYTRNPYQLEHDAGGSSGGSAAAVSANLALLGVGGDTGGSVRVPAAFCNLVGLRPSIGSVPVNGTCPLVGVQDTLGPMARTVADAELLYRVLAGRPPAAASEELATLAERVGAVRVGVLENLVAPPPGGSPEEAAAGVVRRALAVLDDAGIPIVAGLELADAAERIGSTSLYLASSREELDPFIAGLGLPGVRSVRDLYESGQYHPALDLLRDLAQAPPALAEERRRIERAQLDLGADLVRLMAAHRVDVLCYPTARVVAPRISALEELTVRTLEFPANTLLASQCRFPALTVPIGFAGPLPVGLELLGRPHSEDLLLALGRQIEACLGARRPPALS